MRLSIIVVNYNTKTVTLRCLDSIKRYPPKCDFEVIVVDNGSTDGSAKALTKRAKNDETLTIIGNKENLGFAKGNNQGIKIARGEYILLLNSDTEITASAVDKLLEYALSHESVGAVVPKLIDPNGTLQPSVYYEPTVWRAIKQYWFGISREFDKFAPNLERPVKVDVAVMAAFLITPEALASVGLLNEKYFMYFEDFDYCRKLREHGFEICYLPSSVVVHAHGESGKKLAKPEVQWRRLTPSSKIYHGRLKHYLISLILWTGQKPKRMFGKM